MNKREGRQQGERFKQRGQALVLANEREEWKADVGALLDALIERATPFDADDLKMAAWKAGISEPHHPNCWGAVMGGAVKAKRIEMVGIVKAATPSSHASMIGKWVGVES